MISMIVHSLLLIGWIAYTNLYLHSTEIECRNFIQSSSSQPLLLTPYLKSKLLSLGRTAARVPSLLPGIESYAGFFTVNETHDSNMYFWFFPSERNPEGAPVVLWLQGGPGRSGLFGTFTENGPFRLVDGPTLTRNRNYWSQELNVLYVDNPVGTGFSFTRNSKAYASSEIEVARDLYSVILQFLKLMPEYMNNDFIIAGEGYGGKFVTALAHTIHEKNPNAAAKVNLKGISIGNGWLEPLSMINYAEYFYSIGLIDEEAKKRCSEVEENIKSLIIDKKFKQAFASFTGYLSNGSSAQTKCCLVNETGLADYFNYAKDDYAMSEELLRQFLGQTEVMQSIHVGQLQFSKKSATVKSYLAEDLFESALPWLEELMEHYRVLLYYGQLDVACAYPFTAEYLRNMQWSGKEEYRITTRKQWHVGKQLAGYATSVRNFTELLVRDAGHMVPTDQPVWALNMIVRFTKNIPFHVSL